MLVNVVAPNRAAIGMLFSITLQPIPSGTLQPLYACTKNTVDVFCSRTSPPPNGMLSRMALFSRSMVTETTVVTLHAAITVTGFGAGGRGSSIWTSTSTNFTGSIVNNAHCVCFYGVGVIGVTSLHAVHKRIWNLNHQMRCIYRSLSQCVLVLCHRRSEVMCEQFVEEQLAETETKKLNVHRLLLGLG